MQTDSQGVCLSDVGGIKLSLEQEVPRSEDSQHGKGAQQVKQGVQPVVVVSSEWSVLNEWMRQEKIKMCGACT